MPDQSYFYCERCGVQTALGHRPSKTHYCASCRRFTCHACWNDAAVRCDRCAAGPAKTGGITAARPLLDALSAIQGELAGIASRAQAGREPADELANERHLLAAKATSILAAIELALRQVQPRHVVTARSLGRRARVDMASIAEALRPVVPRRAPRRDPRAQLRRVLTAQVVRGRVTTRAFVIPIAALVAGAVGMAAIINLRPADEAPTAGGPSPTPTHEGQIAGGTPASSPGASPVGPGAGTTGLLRFTFDESTAYGPPGSGWDIRDGSGFAEVVPIPDPFDRSLRLTTADGTGPTMICRKGLPDADLVSVDLSAADWRGLSVEVHRGTEAFAIVVDGGSRLLLQVDGITTEVTDRFEATGWQRLTIHLDFEKRSIDVHAEPRDGYAGVSSEVSLPPAWLAAIDRTTDICISSPSNPEEDVYVDNVVLSAGGGAEV